MTQFESLASGYGNSDALRLLSAGQASRRRLLVLAVVQAARDAGLSSEANVNDALTIMAAAERAAPASVGHVLDHPQVATWAARWLRRFRTAERDRSGLTAELGYLAALSVAAAAAAGIGFEIDLPTGGNTIFLPTLGTALITGGRRITIRGVAGAITIGDRTGSIALTASPGEGPDRWLPTRTVSADEDSQGLRLTIEDGDPYRDGYRLPPAERLADADLARFAALLADAWSWIVRHVPAHALSIRAILRSVVPLRPTVCGRTKHFSATSRWAFGSIAMSMPVDAETLALALVHEVQHAKLGALLDLVDLYRDDNRTRYRAPWRLDPRPLEALMQGTYAHLGVTDFWRARGHDDSPRTRLVQLEFAYWRRQVGEAIGTLRSSGALVPAGEHFVACMARTLRAWDREFTEPGVIATASDITEAAAIVWRLRNLRPEPDEVTELVLAWLRGAACPPLPVARLAGPMAPAAAVTSSPRLAEWIRHMVTAPTLPPADESSIGDRHFLAGEYAAAVASYSEQIRREPASEQAWSCLALALGRDGRSRAAEALTARPELVRGMYLGLGQLAPPTDPADLAEWLAGAHGGVGSM